MHGDNATPLYPRTRPSKLGTFRQRRVHELRRPHNLTAARRRALERTITRGVAHFDNATRVRPATVNWLVDNGLIARVGDPDNLTPESRDNRGEYTATILGHEVYGRIDSVERAEHLAHAEEEGRAARLAGQSEDDVRQRPEYRLKWNSRSPLERVDMSQPALGFAALHGWHAQDERAELARKAAEPTEEAVAAVHRSREFTGTRQRALADVVLGGTSTLLHRRPNPTGWLLRAGLIEALKGVRSPGGNTLYVATPLGHAVHGRIERIEQAEHLAYAEEEGRAARRARLPEDYVNQRPEYLLKWGFLELPRGGRGADLKQDALRIAWAVGWRAQEARITG